MKAWLRAAGLILILLSGCVRPVAPPAVPSQEYVAYGRDVMVATANAAASRAGVHMLQRGGNAVDAFAAASFAISVTRPQSTGIGGGGFAVIHLSDGRGAPRDVAVDFRERAPAGARRDMFLDPKLPERASLFGPLAIAVPGTVAGVLEIHQRYGRLPRAEVMAPAIELAENGFPVYPALARAIAEMQPVLRRWPQTARIFLPGGEPLQAGELLRQTDLAATLRAIAADGKAAFYRGPIAAAIAGTVQHLGGVLTVSDLESYRVIDRPTVRGSYRGFDIIGMPPPSSGGVLILEMTNMLQAVGPGALEGTPADRAHLLAEIMRRAYEDRAVYLGDPDFVEVPVERLISPAWAAERMRDFDPKHATERSGRAPADLDVTHTTHMSIIDRSGNAVAATESVNFAFGSGIVADGTGVILNDTMDDFATRPGVPNAYGLVGAEANAVAPGKTPLSSMSPTILLRDGKPFLVAGSPGGSLIITATWQTILNVVDRGMSLPEAVAAPRIHHQAIPNQLNYEPGALSEEMKADLEARGHRLHEVPEMGDVQAVMRLPSGGLVGVSDPRNQGRPAGY